MNRYNKWTEEQINFVLKLREDGLTWNRISRALENTYGVKRTGANINTKINLVQKRNKKIKKEAKEMKIPDNYEPATKKQCRFYASLTTDDTVSKKTISTTANTLYANALKGQLSKSFLQRAIADLLATVKIEEKSTIKAKGRGTGKTVRWSEDEQLILLQNMYDCEVAHGQKQVFCEELVNAFDGRTKRSIEQRWSNLKTGRSNGQSSKYVAFKRQKMEDILINKNYQVQPVIKPKVDDLSLSEVKEVLETLPEQKHARNKKSWKPDEEFELLCNFYELSIDEARNQFGRSYSALAYRLELIVDSAEPEHIGMLKKAAKVISKRKKEQAKNANMSRWKRRSIARKVKKAAKLEKKLNKLRGV